MTTATTCDGGGAEVQARPRLTKKDAAPSYTATRISLDAEYARIFFDKVRVATPHPEGPEASVIVSESAPDFTV